MTPEEFYSALTKYGITLSDHQKHQFSHYFECLIEWNQKINLTAITDLKEVYLKHFFDSLAPILYQEIPDEPLHLLDIGAGAGFPSIPMAIIRPTITVTIIDSLNKRIRFLETLTQELGLTVTLLHGRAEDFAHDGLYRASFDIVTARAVAPLRILSELAIPYLTLSGKLIALKSSNADAEISEAQTALTTLFAKVIYQKNYQLPNKDPRSLIVIEKKKETSNMYPRKAGIPNKRPL